MRHIPFSLFGPNIFLKIFLSSTNNLLIMVFTLYCIKSGFQNLKNVEQQNCVKTTCSGQYKIPRGNDFALFSPHAASDSLLKFKDTEVTQQQLMQTIYS
jgi:hypothetical protein